MPAGFQLALAVVGGDNPVGGNVTDERVNIVTKDLFKKYPTAKDYAAATPAGLQKDIQTVGFFRAKAKSLRSMATALVNKHGGHVPGSMEELTELAG